MTRLPGVECDQRDLTPAWHLRALGLTAAALLLAYLAAVKALL